MQIILIKGEALGTQNLENDFPKWNGSNSGLE